MVCRSRSSTTIPEPGRGARSGSLHDGPGPRIGPICPGLVAILLLTACGSSPTAEPPDVRVEPPPRWTAAEPDATEPDVSEPDAVPWWTHFADPRLDALVDEALERNRDLGTAARVVEAALVQARIAGAGRRPQASVGADAASRREVFVGLPIPGEERFLEAEFEVFATGLAVSWEADLWGRLKAGQKAALAAAAAAGDDYAAARQATAAQTSRAWFTLLETERQRELAERTLESRRVTLERVGARYANGIGAPLDVRLERAAVARAEGAVELRRRQADAARRQVEVLLGRYPAGLLESGASLPEVPAEVPAVLPAELVVRRPDLLAAERRLEAAGWRVAEARRALYPRLSFAASAGTTSDRVADLLDGDFSVWSLAGNLLAPLFSGGRLRAALELAESSRERALWETAAAALRAFAEVESALAAERSLAAQEAALATGALEAAAAVSLAEKRYVAGVGDYLAVLESQRQAFAAQSQLLAVRRERLANRVDLYVALGGDWSGNEIDG